MNTAEADQVIVGSLAVTAVLAIVKRVSEGGSPDVVRVLVGAFIAGTMLTLAAEGVPELAGALGVLLLIASLVYAGPDVWSSITHRATVGNIAPGQTAPREAFGGGGHRVK